jgi:hypothetical protein
MVFTSLQFSIINNFSGKMLTFNGRWHTGEGCSSRMKHGFSYTGQMADSVYGVMWASGLMISTL